MSVNFIDTLFGVSSPRSQRRGGKSMNATTAKRAPRSITKKTDITKLNNKQLEALDEDVFIASLSPWLRKLMTAAQPFKGKLK